MPTRPLIIPAASPLPEEAARVFKGGGVIAYPTETFYGLCVDPFNPAAVERLFSLKGRSFRSPVAVIIAEAGMLPMVAEEVPLPHDAAKLMERFWPGPLTIVLKALPSVPPMLTAGTGSIGVRVSGNPAARALSKALSSPITATSANPSGKRPSRTPEEVLEYFNGSIDILMDGGRLAGRLGSTIVDVSGDGAKVIREGEIPSSEVLSVLR
ncbi:MAG: L-threonylcarbamoyladenylate synthase [Deltaproteobacteria bacterium]|nr:L-threonylcarbamoyladenylate synthase [Deltaproteobacteria bacterium]